MALLLCERQQNWLSVVTVVFRTIGILLRFFYVFLRFFENPKVVTFYVFLPCFVRFLELCRYLSEIFVSWTDRRVHDSLADFRYKNFRSNGGGNIKATNHSLTNNYTECRCAVKNLWDLIFSARQWARYMLALVRLSVCLSVTRMDQSKTVESGVYNRRRSVAPSPYSFCR